MKPFQTRLSCDKAFSLKAKTHYPNRFSASKGGEWRQPTASVERVSDREMVYQVDRLML